MAKHTTAGKETFTPTEELILDTLIGRARLGEQQWPVSRRNKKALQSLADQGYVRYQSGPTEDTYRVFLTRKAIARYLSFDYIPPIAEGSKKVTKKAKAMVKEAKKIKKSLKLNNN